MPTFHGSRPSAHVYLAPVSGCTEPGKTTCPPSAFTSMRGPSFFDVHRIGRFVRVYRWNAPGRPVRALAVTGRPSGVTSPPGSTSMMTTPPLACPVRSPTLPRAAHARACSSDSRGADCQPFRMGRLPSSGVNDQPRP